MGPGGRERSFRVKLLVLGSTGFIGKRFVEMFSGRYEIVTELDGRDEAFIDLIPYDRMRGVLEALRPEAVLNLAGMSYHTARNDAEIYESNVIVQLNLHEAAGELGLSPRVVVCSSSAVYRSSRAPVDEGARCLPANTYARAKYVQERVALGYHPPQHVVVARLFNVIGPRQSTAFFLPAIIERILQYKRGETRSVWLKTLGAMRDFIFVDDVCTGLATLVDRGASGEIYNVCTGTGTSIGEVIDHLRRMLGIAELPLEPQDDSVREGIDYQVGSNKKMLDAGWSPAYDVSKSLEAIMEEYGN
jgi:nucleoside-diphosphate-sugar epimerase